MANDDFGTGKLEKGLFHLVAIPASLGRTAFEFLFCRRQFRPRIAGTTESGTHGTFPIMSPLAYLLLCFLLPSLVSVIAWKTSHADDPETPSTTITSAPSTISISSVLDFLANPTLGSIGLLGLYLAFLSAGTGLLMSLAARICRAPISFVTSWSLAAYATGTFAIVLFVVQLFLSLHLSHVFGAQGGDSSALLAFSPVQLGVLFFATAALLLLAASYVHLLRKELKVGRLHCFGVLCVFLVFVAMVNLALDAMPAGRPVQHVPQTYP